MVKRRVTPLTNTDPQPLLPTYLDNTTSTHPSHKKGALIPSVCREVLDSTDDCGVRQSEVLARLCENKLGATSQQTLLLAFSSKITEIT